MPGLFLKVRGNLLHKFAFFFPKTTCSDLEPVLRPVFSSLRPRTEFDRLTIELTALERLFLSEHYNAWTYYRTFLLLGGVPGWNHTSGYAFDAALVVFYLTLGVSEPFSVDVAARLAAHLSASSRAAVARFASGVFRSPDNFLCLYPPVRPFDAEDDFMDESTVDDDLPIL